MSQSEGSALIHISACIDSEIFTRGIIAFINESLGDRAHITNHPLETLSTLHDQLGDIAILDVKLATPVLAKLSTTRRVTRIILVSEQRHTGMRLNGLLDKVCTFFPARARESELKSDLGTILACHARKAHGRSRCADCPIMRKSRPAPLPLTPRELEVFTLLGRLNPTASISNSLGVSTKTIESHYSNIKSKLSLSTSQELLRAAIDWVEGR